MVKKLTDKPGPREVAKKIKLENLEKAYQEWKLGNCGSLQEISEKYKFYRKDISKYITLKLQLNKNKQNPQLITSTK